MPASPKTPRKRGTAFDTLAAAVLSGRRPIGATISGDAAVALVLTQLQVSVARPMVIVVSGGVAAGHLASALELFGADVLRLPAPEISPFLPIAPSPAATCERLAALHRLAAGPAPAFIVTDPVALARRTLAPSAILRRTGRLAVGDEVDRDALLRGLELGGYSRAPVVEDPGSFAVRGGIVDIYPPGVESPVRVDFFGDSVESIRAFDAESQRTVAGSQLQFVVLPPCREVLLTPDAMRLARESLRVQGGECGVPGKAIRGLLDDLESGLRPLGVEGWLPAFDELVPGSAYLPPDALWVVLEPAAVTRATTELFAVAAVEFREAVKERRIVFPVEQVYTQPDWVGEVLIDALPYDDDPVAERVLFTFPGHEELRRAVANRKGDDRSFEPVAARILAWRKAGKAVVAVAATPGHQTRLDGILGHYALKTRVHEGGLSATVLAELRTDAADVQIVAGDVERGFEAAELELVVLGTSDVVLHQRRFERASPKRSGGVREALLQSFRDLDPGALVVHQDYGIGRYDGLLRISVEGVDGDFLKLGYQGGSFLYVPVHRLDRVQRYSAGEEAVPPLDKLGGVTWEKAKGRARKSAENMAKELVRVQAARRARERTPYVARDGYVEEFEAAFPYDETPDQERAIQDVMGDLDATWPMDRLICGDVGYGKTEVAIRAAFRAVYDRKQVAILVPTTVLAEQHGRSFEARLDGYPISTAVLSRFRSGAEEKLILDRLASGKLDIVIGTHRLLSQDVKFRDLGLMVIDEEHRFGVKHKERLKQLKEMVDVLTLTATPIPRTLNMAISGLRDMSVIATPPSERLAVRTLVSRVSDEVIKEAVHQELARGGQIYFVHNQVETIGVIADRLQRLAPRAKILVAHGQMDEALLERVMLAFIAGEGDILVCTTIIESGLDIPNANTMLIHRAERLGLAQLYQLRGRVGRSTRRAYCYLLVPEPEALDPTARKRIEAMTRYQDLGSGFAIASLDMEIRGAGNLLGGAQSGHVKDVGLELFSELLAEAVADLQGVAETTRVVSCEMKVALSAYLPDTYVPDIHLRLWFYKRIASAREPLELEDAFADLADRAGRLPPEAVRLKELSSLKLECQAIGAKMFSFGPIGGSGAPNTGAVIAIAFDSSSPFAGPLALELVNRRETRWKLTPTELVRTVSALEWDRGLDTGFAAIRELAHLAHKRSTPVKGG